MWWPASGYRYSGSGALGNVGTAGYCWSSVRHSIAYRSYNLYLDFNGNLSLSNYSYRGLGYPVRCVQERAKER